MDWPLKSDVNVAGSQQLFDWYRWLESPKTLEQDNLWMRIEERCKEMGIFEGPAYKKLSQDATAHHEAGHAVIALALGVPITHVEIFSDQDGKCYYAKRLRLKMKPRTLWFVPERGNGLRHYLLAVSASVAPKRTIKKQNDC